MEELGLPVALRLFIDLDRGRAGALAPDGCLEGGTGGGSGAAGSSAAAAAATGAFAAVAAPATSSATSSAGAASATPARAKSGPAPEVGWCPIVAIAAEPKRDAAAKNRAAGFPSQCHDRATPVGSSSANGESTPPVSDIAQKSRARSATMASGAAKAPSDSCAPARVRRKSDSSAPPIASASRRGSPRPSTIAMRAKRVKRPEAAAR